MITEQINYPWSGLINIVKSKIRKSDFELRKSQYLRKYCYSKIFVLTLFVLSCLLETLRTEAKHPSGMVHNGIGGALNVVT